MSESTAQPSPLEPGKYLVPANATTKEPLKAKSGFAICFMGDGWQYIKDERGNVYYDAQGNEVEITRLNQDISKLSKEKPKPKIDEKARELAEFEAQIKEAEDDILRAILIGNDAVLPELRREYKELLAQKQALEKGDNIDEKAS